jgi:hypothetical protein
LEISSVFTATTKHIESETSKAKIVECMSEGLRGVYLTCDLPMTGGAPSADAATAAIEKNRVSRRFIVE